MISRPNSKDGRIISTLNDWGGYTAKQGALINERGYNVFRQSIGRLYRGKQVSVAGKVPLFDNSVADPRFYIPQERRLGPSMIPHEHELTRIRLALQQALLRPYAWYRRDIKFGEFHPDAIWNIQHQAWHGFCEEMERSQASTSRPSKTEPRLYNSLLKKAAAFIRFRDWWKALGNDNRPGHLFRMDDFHLNLTFLTQARTENALALFATAEGGRFKLRTFRFSTLTQRLTDPLGSIFQTPKDFSTGQTYSVFE